MSIPKRRRTKARRNRGKRNLQKKKVVVKKLVKCSKCSAKITPHRVCPKCGFYKGREVVDVMKKAKKSKAKKQK
ncbi:50S ribosomal protein L32 [Patescibacteria group bacterium]